MKEEFIYYLWENKLLRKDLISTDQEPVEILHSGYRNSNAGPDFLNARIKIGTTVWAGNVEIHVISSDWLLHNHQHDKAFDNVILHIVYQEDKKIFTTENQPIPTVEIKGMFDENIFLRYHDFINSKHWIACEKQVGTVQHFTWLSWLDRLIVEKLEMKIDLLKQLFIDSKSDWEETFYRRLMINLGFKVNDNAFEQLARSIPINLLLRHADKLHEIEALLFGQAGMLEKEFNDRYPNQLRETYSFLAKKYPIKPMNESSWRFMRLRPANFPTIRIAQFASLIHEQGQLFSKIVEVESVDAISDIFRGTASTYWDIHYQFDKQAENRKKQMGDEAVNLLLINSVVQMLFFYGQYIENESLTDKALMILESIEPENNQTIRKYTEFGVQINNALQSQALLFLKSHYCDQKRCIECRVGQILLNQSQTI
ncbi:MAG: DUF2851 family protein [Bacteroidales bacterium]|nr:DUF2851 family protein [Bacteroidales bacterium]